MTVNLVENIMLIINQMYTFIERFYCDIKSGKVRNEYAAEDFLLPKKMISVLRKIVIRVKDRKLSVNPKYMNIPILKLYCMIEFNKIRHDSDDMKFVELAAFLCLTAFKYEENGIEGAAETVIKIIHQNSLRYRKYHIFKCLGCCENFYTCMDANIFYTKLF